MERGESNGEHYDRVLYHPHHQHRYCTALQSIDTVRALHQTVVSLRSALDDSRLEIEKLKKQIIVNNEIQEARPCHHPTVSNSQLVDFKSLGDKVSELEKIYYKTHPKGEEKVDENVKKSNLSLAPEIRVSTQNLNDTSTFTATSGMASRIDVKIKVSSNINVDNNETSTTTSERSDSPAEDVKEDEVEEEKDEVEPATKESKSKSSKKSPETSKPSDGIPKVEVEMYEDSNTNTFNVDTKNLKIRVTSEDNINITKSTERISAQQSSSEYLNLDIDEMSEGDNSVFTEGATTPIEQRLQQVEDASDGENETGADGELPREEHADEQEDIPDDVDDIELIFSSEDNREAIQEDLVSLSEYEPWNEGGEDGMPILTKFSTLTSEDRDREAYYEKKKALKAARVARTQSDLKHSLESTDSLSFDNPKSSSLDKDNSLDHSMSREESFDTFKPGMTKKWTNVNVLIETDMSKVGIGDENILDMGRRNTCPNPPLYR
jgi:hypothetical protein